MSVALPKAVRAQIEAANNLAQELAAQRNPPPEPEAQPEAPPAEAQPQEQAPAATDWEQRYKVLQGKYNAEVPRLQRQTSEMSGRLEQLQQQLTATQGMLASFGQRAAAPVPESAPPARLVKDEEIQTFGQDLYDFVKRAAREATLPELEERIRPVRQQVEEVRGTAQNVVRRTSEAEQQRVLAMLDAQVPDWRTLNEDHTFLDWLAKVDPYTGRQRGELLREAYVAHDGPRVVAFFKGFLTEHATVAPQPAAPAPAPQAQAGSQRTLEEFTAPGAVKPPGATSAPEGTNKRIWAESEIKRFYDQCTAGVYRTNQKRRDEIEREIHKAVAEGRVQPGR